VIGSLGSFIVQLLGYLVEYDGFQILIACTLVFGSFALARALTRRKRERGGGAQ
jgi:hypothetical protein